MLKEVRSTATLTIIGIALAFGSQATISRAFGTSSRLDDYWLAYAICMMATFFVPPLRDALSAESAKRLLGSAELAGEHASALFSWLAPRLLAVAVALATFAALIGLMTQRSNLAWMLFAFSFAVPAFAVSEFMSGLLLAISRPAWQQCLRLLIPVIAILAVVLLGHRLGPASLIVAFGVAHLTIITAAMSVLRRQGLRLRWVPPRAPDAAFLRAVLALAINAYLVSTYLALDKFVFGQLQVGATSAFQYAVAITNILIMLAGGIAATTLNPIQLHDAHRDGRVWNWMVKVLITMGLGLLAVLIPIWVAADCVVAIVFAGKNFDSYSQTLTVEMLRSTIFTALPASIVMFGMRLSMLLSGYRIITVNGLVVAGTGSIVVMAGWLLGNPSVVSVHWLAANLAGAGAILFGIKRRYG